MQKILASGIVYSSEVIFETHDKIFSHNTRHGLGQYWCATKISQMTSKEDVMQAWCKPLIPLYTAANIGVIIDECLSIKKRGKQEQQQSFATDESCRLRNNKVHIDFGTLGSE